MADNSKIESKKLEEPVVFIGASPRPSVEHLDLADGGQGYRRRSGSLCLFDAMERKRLFSSQLDISGHRPSVVRTDKVTVTVRVVFLKIGEIETVKECFSAEAFIQAKWREPSLDYLIDTPSQIDEIKWDKYWNPHLTVVNALGDPKESVWYSVIFNAQREALVCERRRIKGTFLENLELNEFPFDTQDISMTLMSERSSNEVDLEADGCEASSINVQSFVDEQEWRLYKHVLTSRSTVERVYQESTDRHSMLSFTCRAKRRIGFFVWNIFFVMFFICSMTFTTFGLEHTLIPNRLQLTFILLLTTITFKFTVSQSLPKISYLTYLDYYVLASMVTICLICIWHGLIGSIIHHQTDPKTATWYDLIILCTFASVYGGGHVALIIFIFVGVLRARRRDKEDERKYLEKSKTLSEQSRSFLMDLSNIKEDDNNKP